MNSPQESREKSTWERAVAVEQQRLWNSNFILKKSRRRLYSVEGVEQQRLWNSSVCGTAFCFCAFCVFSFRVKKLLNPQGFAPCRRLPHPRPLLAKDRWTGCILLHRGCILLHGGCQAATAGLAEYRRVAELAG